MATIDELKQLIDLHDLADKLGMKKGKGGNKANYHSPHHDDKSPSLSIFKGGKAWKDFSTQEGGSCVDLVQYVEGGTVGEAVKRLHEIYSIPMERREKQETRPKSTVEYIAERCLEQADKAIEYLVSRGISEQAIKYSIENKSVGYNDWASPKIPAGEPTHGGPAAAFIVRTLNPGHVVAVDMRYLDPVLNGGLKTQTQGEKYGHGWTSSLSKLKSAHTVIIVESPINALSVDTANMYGYAAFAVRGLNVEAIEWHFLTGKRVLICMDNDEPFPDGHKMAGHRPGPEAAWKIHEILTGLNISALMIDQAEWEHNDVNDMLKASGAYELQMALKKVEDWLIPGMAGKDGKGRKRIYLPSHDFAQYWKYRVKQDFTTFITKMNKNEETEVETPAFSDLCGFRVASVSRVSVAGATATMTGDPDTQPQVYFAVSVQTPRHGPKLIRRVLDDDKLHNVDQWKKFGPVWQQGPFLRMLNILERTADLGARSAANFVGLAWRDGKLIVNEGPDTYFMDPDKQCPYHNLTFPSGSRQDAVKVIEAYQGTFKKNAALLPIVWGLGGHLKAILGFWPHMIMQADKGMGKSTLIKRMERTLAFTMFSGQSLQTEFRLLTSISATSHPVGWEELSARDQKIIDKAVGLLQENYQYTITRRGSDMTQYLLCAPVMLAGEDVPVKSLLGKLIRTELTGKKGPIMDENLPRFPLKQWLEFLAGLTRPQVIALQGQMRDTCRSHSRASGEDEGATRMAGNYAAILTAWRLLCEFTGIDVSQGDFEDDILAEMNAHIAETSADREPWVWIMETALSEIAAGKFSYPYKWDGINGDPCLCIRTSHIMDHIAHTSALRDKWNALPVKSDRVFKKQITHAGVIIEDQVERKVADRRISHMVAISLSKLEGYGLYATPTSDLSK